MGSNTFKKVKAHAKLTLIGLVLSIKGEALNIVEASQLTAATAHEAIQQTGTQFTMIDEGESISVRSKLGVEVLSIPGTDENKEFYGDHLMTPDEYILKGGVYAERRRAVVNGNAFFMDTYDTATGESIAMDQIGRLEDDIDNNYTMSVEELIDLAKVLSGGSIIDMPTDLEDKLAYFDVDKGTLVQGNPSVVLAGALKSVGFDDEQIDTLFEGTVLEDPERRDARLSEVNEEDLDVASDKNTEVIYYDAMTVDGKLDLEHKEEMKPADINQMLIDKYSNLVKDYLDGDERVGEFTVMLGEYVKDASEEERNMKIATLVSIFDDIDRKDIKKDMKRLDRRVEKIWADNRATSVRGKGSKFTQFDKMIDERIDIKLEEVDDIQTRFDRLTNAHEEAMEYCDSCIAEGKILPSSYEYVCALKEHEIFESCGGVTEEEVTKSWDELDKLEKDKRKMQDYKFISFVLEEGEVSIDKARKEEVKAENASWISKSWEDAKEAYSTIQDADEVFATITENTKKEDNFGISISAKPIFDSSLFNDEDEELVSSDELDEVSAAYEDKENEEEDADIKIYNMDHDFDL